VVGYTHIYLHFSNSSAESEKVDFVNSCPSRLFRYDKESGRVHVEHSSIYTYDGEAVRKVSQSTIAQFVPMISPMETLGRGTRKARPSSRQTKSRQVQFFD
jgi:hypothetical protein